MKRFLCFLVLFVFIPILSFTDVDLSPVGRWSISSDYSTMHDNFMFSKTDFFFFEDGSVYRVSITKNKKENRLDIGSDDGIWVGDKDLITIRIGKDIFQANIDDEGFLYISKSDMNPLRFFRVIDPDGDV